LCQFTVKDRVPPVGLHSGLASGVGASESRFYLENVDVFGAPPRALDVSRKRDTLWFATDDRALSVRHRMSSRRLPAVLSGDSSGPPYGQRRVDRGGGSA